MGFLELSLSMKLVLIGFVLFVIISMLNNISLKQNSTPKQKSPAQPNQTPPATQPAETTTNATQQ